jgi:hypothetical protein
MSSGISNEKYGKASKVGRLLNVQRADSLIIAYWCGEYVDRISAIAAAECDTDWWPVVVADLILARERRRGKR